MALPFLAAITLVELTPGPNMGYLAALSAAEGRKAGFKAVLGVTLGLAVYMFGAVFGVTGVIANAPLVYGALRWAGGAFLLYLAWEAWSEAVEARSGRAVVSDAAPFWRGLIANLLNPKAALFYVTLLPSFVTPHGGPFWLQALWLGSIHLAVSVIVHVAIVLGAARAASLLTQPRRLRALRRVLAVGIALIAAWLAWETRPR